MVRCAYCKRAQGLLLPPSSQRVINLYQRKPFVKVCLGQVQPRGKVTRVTIKHLKVARRAAAIANVGKPSGVLGGFRQQLLLLPKFLVLDVGN